MSKNKRNAAKNNVVNAIETHDAAVVSAVVVANEIVGDEGNDEKANEVVETMLQELYEINPETGKRSMSRADQKKLRAKLRKTHCVYVGGVFKG